jgi:hypothetical protein
MHCFQNYLSLVNSPRILPDDNQLFGILRKVVPSNLLLLFFLKIKVILKFKKKILHHIEDPSFGGNFFSGYSNEIL